MAGQDGHSPNLDDEYYADGPILRAFVATVRATLAQETDPTVVVEQLRPAFARLLELDGWLPKEFSRPYHKSGMGGGIGQYLLFRAADRSLTLFSLVVPSGSSTPVHDHLAWGLVGLYRGEQREEMYALESGQVEAGTARLRLVEERTVHTGDFYALLPPTGDIHRVTTTSATPSISIHLLGNDTGCVARHRFEPATGEVAAFRSGYSNVPCMT